MGAHGFTQMNSRTTDWQSWIFDLDDTLLDTSGDLIPAAMKKACGFLVSEGALTSIDVGLQKWSQWRLQKTGIELFKKIIELDDINRINDLAHETYDIFRRPLIPKKLNLLPGAIEILTLAKKKIPIFIVTQGDLQTQINKIKTLKIHSYFKDILYVDPYSGQSKQIAFSQIIGQYGFAPDHVLCIGNRLDNEISLGKKVGLQTCYIPYGEHSNESPASIFEIPDFKLTSLFELKFILPISEEQ